MTTLAVSARCVHCAWTTDPADAIATPEQARAFLGKWDGDFKRAVRETHPDAGGDPTEFRKVIRARELVGA